MTIFLVFIALGETEKLEEAEIWDSGIYEVKVRHGSVCQEGLH